MDKLEQHLRDIEEKLGSSEVIPEDVTDKLEWHLNKIEELIEQGGGGGGGSNIPDCPTSKDGTFRLVCVVVNKKRTYVWIEDTTVQASSN